MSDKIENNIERRIYNVKEYRVSKNDKDESILEGHSVVFDTLSDDLGYGDWKFFEKVDSKAFDNVLKNADVRALFNHEPNLILGRQSAKTLILKKDNEGIHSTIILPDTTYANDLAVSVERGDIREQSFAFRVLRDNIEEDRENKVATRTILEIEELLDISPVTYPAYPDTTIAKRSLDQFRNNAANRDNDNDLENQDQENIEFDNLQDEMLIKNSEENLNHE